VLHGGYKIVVHHLGFRQFAGRPGALYFRSVHFALAGETLELLTRVVQFGERVGHFHAADEGLEPLYQALFFAVQLGKR